MPRAHLQATESGRSPVLVPEGQIQARWPAGLVLTLNPPARAAVGLETRAATCIVAVWIELLKLRCWGIKTLTTQVR
jgi:hypothetical protein